MHITRENYGRYFIDHFEGRLSASDREVLIRFLELHPDLKEEFDSFEMVCLEGDEVCFPGKDSLKKPVEGSASAEQGQGVYGREITLEEAASVGAGMPVSEVTPTNYELYFAAYVEGDLDPPAMMAVETFAASDKRYARELSLMKQTRFVPGTEVTYPQKGTLKQHHIPAMEHSGSHLEEGGGTTFRFLTRRRIWNAASVAAAVLFLGVLTFTIFSEHQGIQVAIHDGEPPVVEDQPVGGDTGHPLAVADALTPQSPELDPPEAVLLSSDTQRLRTDQQPGDPGYQAMPDRRTADDRTVPGHHLADILPGGQERMFPDGQAAVPLFARRMEPMGPSILSLSDVSTRAHTQMRDEFYWMAAVDPSGLFLEEEEAVHGEGRREVSLAQLAVGQVEERTGIRIGEAGEMLSGERTSILGLAGRGLSELNNLIGQPVVVDGETTEDGRRITFALGDFIQVSRK